jgi:hypothetical protein
VVGKSKCIVQRFKQVSRRLLYGKTVPKFYATLAILFLVRFALVLLAQNGNFAIFLLKKVYLIKSVYLYIYKYMQELLDRALISR